MLWSKKQNNPPDFAQKPKSSSSSTFQAVYSLSEASDDKLKLQLDMLIAAEIWNHSSDTHQSFKVVQLAFCLKVCT